VGPDRDGCGASSLTSLLKPVETADIEMGAGDGLPEWLRANDWRVFARPRHTRTVAGDVLERFTLASGDSVVAVRGRDGVVRVPFDLEEAYRTYITESWSGGTELRSLSIRNLRLFYRVKRLLPRTFWWQMRRFLIRLRPAPDFPAWPLEDSVDRLVRFYAHCLLVAADADTARFAWFWPSDYRAALILTHDVESAEGLRLAVELADLEESRGLRSSFNIVGGQYAIDAGIVRELAGRGFEIGLHGLLHDRSLFSSRSEFERQLPRLEAAAQRLGAVGFRSPATYRVIDWLPELPVDYDCSVPHADRYEPQPGGCCSLWPYMLGRIVELPWTLPQDHILFTLLRERSPKLWLQQLDAIERRFGLIQCLTHPDPGYLGDADKRALYVEFLDAVAERPGIWRALPREVASWWRRRDGDSGESSAQGLATMRRRAAPAYADFEPPVL
jgi:peptidoglycan/xylan/chitin deacetylase (PgdA/CDA1 family)